MPFTLSHPIAVLPFHRSRYFHFPALVLGSMSSDFVYYLSGKPTDGGHSIFGSEWLNLPLCGLFYLIYRFLLQDMLRKNLPRFWASSRPKQAIKSPLFFAIIFLYSAWLGMLTHILLDNFTHQTGYFVQQFPVLQTEWKLPIFKWLQYGGGIIGFVGIMYYQWRIARQFPFISTRSAYQKGYFWLGNLLLTTTAFLAWSFLSPLSLAHYATQIIRLVDCGIMSLLIYGMVWKIKGYR
ncbi:DUF4184 family protein [Mannheimia indoligenes]|uniref:DUF4184 family protein n=1 Tax=Mannheimia indoligenes TaxID=3103145 RepID=UPI002FE5CF2C